MATTPAPLDPKIGMTREGFNLLFKATSLSPSLSSIFNERDTVDFRPYLGKIKVPTLILHGSCDELIPVAAGYYLKNSIPHAELIVLPGRTHLFPVFDRKEVIKLLSVFQLIFDRHLRPSSLRYTENR